MSEGGRESVEQELPREIAPAERARGDELYDPREPPAPFQPLRALLTLALTTAAFALYEFVLSSFWSSPLMGIHERVPYPAYLGLAIAMLLALAAVRAALGVWSAHLKLGLFMLAFLTGVVVGVGGGRFVSYTLRGTRNPEFTLTIADGQRFPDYALADQNGSIHRGPRSGDGRATLVVIYRGDFCAFARYELAELTANRAQLDTAGLGVVAISADPVERSHLLARFLKTAIPLLSDQQQTVLGPLGLVQHHRNRQPDSAIPAFIIVDGAGIVRWTFTSPYYREMPSTGALLAAARRVKSDAPRQAR
ncbi:MAG: redoxin domain-containing protein [Candidatus Binataceae bacterium]